MQYIFSAEFLKVLPPATNFGEAWEELCLALLQAEFGDHTIMRLGPPDRGIDIIHRRASAAYQCKSSERGALGTIDAQSCIDSLARAIEAKLDLALNHYFVALNAPLSGVGLSKILDFATSQGTDPDAVEVLPHDHWEALCAKHKSVAESHLDYRVFVSETEVRELLIKARYYDQIVEQAARSIQGDPLQIGVSNNRTPIQLIIPFSNELTVETLLDVVKTKLGLNLEWANFPDLRTSCGPSLSLTVDRKAQPFKTKLGELTQEQLSKLQLWIKLMWRDELQTGKNQYDGTIQFQLYRLALKDEHRPDLASTRGAATIKRMEELIQATAWRAILKARH